MIIILVNRYIYIPKPFVYYADIGYIDSLVIIILSCVLAVSQSDNNTSLFSILHSEQQMNFYKAKCIDSQNYSGSSFTGTVIIKTIIN